MLKINSQLQRDVTDELRWDPRVGTAEIGVAVRDGVITLSGEVDSYARKYAAVKAAERVVGVRAIAEELTVKLPTSSTRNDTELAHAIVETFAWDVLVPDEKITVRVQHGWVTLEGILEWQYQSNAAERAVRNLIGVRGVTNLLALKQHVSVADVKERIESALKRHAVLDSKQINVEALNGCVTLRGKVNSWNEKQQAEFAAWSAPGVITVDDELLIGA